MLYLPCHSSIVSTQFLFLFFWFSIIHMHYHIIMLILDHQQFSVFLSEDIFLCKYFSIKSYILCFSFQCLLITLYLNSWNLSNFIINFITNQITSYFSCFLNCSFQSSFKCICCKLFSMIKNFWLFILSRLLLMF